RFSILYINADAIHQRGGRGGIERLTRPFAQEPYYLEKIPLARSSGGRPQLGEASALALPLLVLGVEEHQLNIADRLGRGPIRRLKLDEFMHVLQRVGRLQYHGALLPFALRITRTGIKVRLFRFGGDSKGVTREPARVNLTHGLLERPHIAIRMDA